MISEKDIAILVFEENKYDRLSHHCLDPFNYRQRLLRRQHQARC